MTAAPSRMFYISKAMVRIVPINILPCPDGAIRVTVETVTHDSAPATEAENTAAGRITQFVERAQSLYSLPTVAMEVLRLTSDEQASAGDIKRCIERDPAMTAKILKVVNSPLFGLSGKVSDLNQALALLGLKPLKLLVLGFSLPKEMLQGIEAEALARYWQFSLTKAVAAREIAAIQQKTYGDEAFIAGLLSEIGTLVLLQELGDAYAQFVTKVRQEEADLFQMELETLGFDHGILGCRLLQSWGLPETLIETVHHGRPNSAGPSASCEAPAGTLRLAHQLAEILADHRLQVLPEFLERLTTTTEHDPMLVESLVIEIQQKLFQLADVLSVVLPEEAPYGEIMRDAYRQLAQLSEEVAPSLAVASGEVRTRIIESPEAIGLVESARNVARSGRSGPVRREEMEGPSGAKSLHEPKPVVSLGMSRDLQEELATGLGQARARRADFSLILLTIDHFEPFLVAAGLEELDVLRQLVAAVADRLSDGLGRVVPVSDKGLAVLLEDHDRHQSVSVARQIVEMVQNWSARRESHRGANVTLSGGVASVSVPPKGLPSETVFEAARRCVAAATRGGGNCVKSIEII